MKHALARFFNRYRVSAEIRFLKGKTSYVQAELSCGVVFLFYTLLA